MLLQKQYVAHIIGVIDDSMIQQAFNVHVIHLFIHYVGHKSEKWVCGIDLDHIFTKGLFKNLSIFDMLSVDDLLQFVRVFDETV